ncbi:MAG: WecB/TagA/CpsF family glycosyltransferase [Bacillota bacterium]
MVQRVNILGAPVDAVTITEAVARVGELLARGGTHQVVTLNPEYLYRAQKEPDLLTIAREASLVTADGVGIVWAASVCGYSLPERVTGIDLMLELSKRAAAEGWRVFLLGGKPGVAEDAASRLTVHFPGLSVAGTYHGYFTAEEETAVLGKINAAEPHILFVGLGAPKQEEWIYNHNQLLNVPVAVGVGGSFDVLSGRVKRAPAWMRRLGLEWLGRLIREPRRWRRMLVLPLFAFLVLRTRVKTTSGCGGVF